MTEVIQPGVEATPAAGTPPATPPEPVAPTPNPAPVPVQPVTLPIQKVLPPPPPAPPAPTPPAPTPPATPPAPKDTGLLDNLEPVVRPIEKPTLESMKIPQGYEYPKDFLSGIVSDSSSQDEAQKRFETAHQLRTAMERALVNKNTEWIQSLKNDPEMGKDKWEGSLALYRKGVVEEFGENFAKILHDSKIDAQPDMFKAIVRRMRAKNPSPVVLGESTVTTPTEPETPQAMAKRIYKNMTPASPAQRTSPSF